MLAIHPIKAFTTNYIWALINWQQRCCAIVDPGDSAPVIDFLKTNQLRLTAILITHHHYDHVDGIMNLLYDNPCPVYGPLHEEIGGVSHRLSQDDQLKLDELAIHFTVLDVPGHTKGHIAYLGLNKLFIGDTLFSAGCGRLLGGTMQQLWQSMVKLAKLADHTEIYCAHEYTLANLKFAKMVEPNNPDIENKINACQKKLKEAMITLPAIIGEEKKINPFLRYRVGSVKIAAEKYAKRPLKSDFEVFATLRIWKDQCLL